MIGALEAIIALLMVLLGGVFWIWMIRDCDTNEPIEGNRKLFWLVIIVCSNIPGALIYCFLRRPERQRELGR